jgi:MFS family permease
VSNPRRDSSSDLRPDDAAHTAHSRVALAVFVGTAMEWYDYFLFGLAASLVFSRLYFSDMSPVASALAAFATFGVGFVARPVGAVLFGWIGDRIGRKPALLMTVSLIGIATGLIGLLPDYAAIGVAAPSLLVLLRLTQGIAVGGEWGGAMTMAVEHAPVGRRGWFAALPQLGSPVGSILSSGSFALALHLPSDQFDAWGWRVPFLLAFPLLVIALYIRRAVEESPVFAASVTAQTSGGAPVLQMLRQNPAELAIGVGIALLGVGGFYMLTAFAIDYGVRVLGMPRSSLVNATLIAAFVELLVIVAVGRIADRFEPWRLTCIGAIICALLAVPVFMLMETRDSLFVLVAIAGGIAAVAAVYAVTGALLTQLFPAPMRYSGVALAYNLAGVVAGFLPFVATALLAATNSSLWAPALLLVAVAFITAVSALAARRLVQQ